MFYSFDVFDTIITRKTATPLGIFKLMQEQLLNDSFYDDISGNVKSNFYGLRIKIEKLVRVSHCYNGVQDVTLSQIYEGFVKTGYITGEQAGPLADLELHTEMDNILGIQENIDKIKELLKEGNRVALISDMYLGKDAIRRILLNVDEVIADLPLYVSSEYKKNKWNGALYPIVKEQEKVEYSDWIHIGDNVRSDVQIPEMFGIRTRRFRFEELKDIEKYMMSHDNEGIYTEYAAAASRYVRMQHQLKGASAVGAAAGANILVPYVLWVVNEAVKREVNRLYFIARDGYILKMIADKVIQCKGYPIRTKYIYGSRKAWRLPAVSESNQDLVDLVSWSHTAKINSLDKLAEAFGITISELLGYLPDGFDRQIRFTPYTLYLAVKQMNENPCFKAYLIKKNKNERRLVKKYLSQNIDISDDRYAFVELAGGGYTQRCLADILYELGKDTGIYEEDQIPGINTFYFKMDRLNKWKECRQSVFFPEYDVKNIIVEMICRACHGQTVGYEEKDGQVIPKLDGEGKQLLDYKYDEYIEGIMKYTDYMCEKNPAMVDLGYRCGMKTASLYLSYLLNTKESEEFLFYADMPNNETGRAGNTEQFAPLLTDGQIEKIFYSERFQARESVYKGSCFELSLLRCNGKQRKMIEDYKKKAGAEDQEASQDRTFETCFPLGLLGDRIVLYAAGKYGNQLFDMIKGHPDKKVVQWIDQNSEYMDHSKMQIVGIQELGLVEYDSILIGVVDENAAESIRTGLLAQGAPAHKIFWFSKSDIYRYLVGNQLFRWM